jgi:hypothetical protein
MWCMGMMLPNLTTKYVVGRSLCLHHMLPELSHHQVLCVCLRACLVGACRREAERLVADDHSSGLDTQVCRASAVQTGLRRIALPLGLAAYLQPEQPVMRSRVHVAQPVHKSTALVTGSCAVNPFVAASTFRFLTSTLPRTYSCTAASLQGAYHCPLTAPSLNSSVGQSGPLPVHISTLSHVSSTAGRHTCMVNCRHTCGCEASNCALLTSDFHWSHAYERLGQRSSRHACNQSTPVRGYLVSWRKRVVTALGIGAGARCIQSAGRLVCKALLQTAAHSDHSPALLSLPQI